MKTLFAALFAVTLAYAQVSVPVVPPIPAENTYGLGSLYLFKQYTRDSYLREFGVQAPPYDRSRRVKTWFDTSVPATSSTAQYDVLHGTKFDKLTLTRAEASSVNLPGKYNYPPFSVVPTNAKIVIGNGVTVSLDASFLTTQQQAEQLAAELKCPLSTVKEYAPVAMLTYVYPSDEERRVYHICEDRQAGPLWVQRNATGVGRPGTWNRFQFTPEQEFEANDPNVLSVSLAVPVRTLQPGETLRENPFGVTVHRGITSIPAGAVSMGPVDEALSRIESKLDRLLKLLGVQ
jgi:hypothetical protein